MDERYASMYADVLRMGRIFTTFAILAIIVACLGLFALASFMVEQRSKEISIRLVLGASLKSIFQLLTSNFVRLVLISIVLAIPIAWFAMDKWLQDFAYPAEMGWEIFVMPGVIAVIIALVTVSYQSIRAALVSPAQNLRSE
jgi:putative ABC transport system permease protein